MRKTVTQWADKLSGIPLPAVPQSAALARQLSVKDNIQLRRLAAVIEEDPGLTAALLRKINAVRHKHLQHDITTVQHGLMMLGMDRARQLPDSVASIAQLRSPRVREQVMRLFGQAQHAAWQARDWARLRHDTAPDEHYVGALLHNSAEILLWIAAPELMEQLEEGRAEAGEASEEVEYVVFGFALDELTLELTERWGLPGLLREGLHPENAQKQRTLGVMLAARLARAAHRDWYSPETTAAIEQVAEYLSFDFGGTAARVHRTAVDAAHGNPCEWIAPAAAHLLHPSRPEAEPGWDRRAERAHQGAPLCLVPQPDVTRDVLKRLAAEPVQLRLTEILPLSLEGMHDGLGLNRAVFAMLNREGYELRVHHVIGSDNDPAFNNHFVIPLSEKSLFTKLMQGPQALWVTPDTYDRFKAVIPPYFRNLVRTREFFAVSLFAGKSPVGLFYADRHNSDCRLDGKAYHQFKQLVREAGQALTRAHR